MLIQQQSCGVKHTTLKKHKEMFSHPCMGIPNALSLSDDVVTLVSELPCACQAWVAGLYEHLIPADGLELLNR